MTCAEPACGTPVKARGLCDSHYQRSRRKGELEVLYPKDGRSLTPRYKRSATLQHRYSITIEQYEDLLESQGFRCAICRVEESQTGKALSVDHDHACCAGRRSCGKCIRGLLCYSCNTHLGWYDRNASEVERYLEATP